MNPRHSLPLSRPLGVFLTILLVAMALFSPARAQAPRLERAIAADLTASGRDAIVFRLADGSGAGVFLPAADGRFILNLHPALGPDLESLTLGDADHDGRADLLVTRGTGELVFWKGLAGGDFTSELVEASHHAGDLHAAHRAATGVAPALTGADRDRIVASMAHASIRSSLTVAELGAASVSLPERPVFSAATIDRGSDETAETAALMQDGRLVIFVGVRADRAVEIGLPEGFSPRLVASGRFAPGEARSFAVVGDGVRPRLVLVAPDAGTTSSATGLQWSVREVSAPEAVFNVNVGSGGLSYAPATVNIQVGDTVHWIFVNSGHTVTSGSSCTADNLFCSPANLNCATGANSPSGTTYDRVFPAPGSFPYFCRPHCNFGMTGTVNVAAAASPGVVPDRLPAVPLRVNRGAGVTLALSWGASCSGGVTAYGIYEGTIPIAGAYDHKSNACPAGIATSAIITPVDGGNHYYLVVPRTATAEGSYGKNSATVEIPVGTTTCVAPQNLAACP